MNPVFIVLIIAAAVVVWFLLSIAYIPLGNLILKIWKNAIKKINKEDESEEK